MSQLILVVDDDPDQRRLVERVLAGAGYRVLTASDGEAGIAAVTAVRPDLVVLDVLMPRMNGLQTCRAFRETAGSAVLPVIMLTAEDPPADLPRAAEGGANAYLTKPLDITRLLDAIAEQLEAP